MAIKIRDSLKIVFFLIVKIVCSDYWKLERQMSTSNIFFFVFVCFQCCLSRARLSWRGNKETGHLSFHNWSSSE